MENKGYKNIILCCTYCYLYFIKYKLYYYISDVELDFSQIVQNNVQVWSIRFQVLISNKHRTVHISRY